MKLFAVMMLLFSGLIGCASGNCRSQPNSDSAKKVVEVPSSAISRVKVFKPDGSLQCGMGKAISVTDMAKELKGIKIHSSKNMNDGQMRIQVCGSPTGQANVYEIDKVDLEKALALGFKQWTAE